MNRQRVKLNIKRQKRKWRVRKKLRGTALKPRMSVVKSNRNVSVQLIDDEAGKTICSASTLAKEFKGGENSRKNKTSAKALGEQIARLAKEQNILEVAFDRGQFKYHGILAELAEASREAGLKF